MKIDAHYRVRLVSLMPLREDVFNLANEVIEENATLRARVEELAIKRDDWRDTSEKQHDQIVELLGSVRKLTAACSAKDEALAEIARAVAGEVLSCNYALQGVRSALGRFESVYGACPCGAPATVMLEDENVCRLCAAGCALDEALALLEPLVRALDTLAQHGPNVAQSERDAARAALLRARGEQ